MKRLFLLRHAKAQPADGSTEDFDRTLLLSGMQDASAMAGHLREGAYSLEMILCSAAARTTQTAELVLQQIPSEVEYRDNLYLAEASKLLAAVRGASASVTNLMLVGHNPGLENAATVLAREPVRRKERARHEALEEKFPTGALAILDFDVGRWRDVEKNAGKLVDFVRPKDLYDRSPIGYFQSVTRELIKTFLAAPTRLLHLAASLIPMPHVLHTRMPNSAETGGAARHLAYHVERVLRCRKCFRSGNAVWEATPTGARALLALSEGFHRRARMPLSLPPEIVCDCGMVQPDHD